MAIDLAAATQGSTGFGVAACDLDLDGDDDLVVANGHVRRPDGTPPGPSDDPLAPYRQPLQLFRNDDGRFREAACGERALCEPMLARGLAVGDLDDDGDLDLLVNRTGSSPLLIRNEASGADTHWLRVRTELPDAGAATRSGPTSPSVPAADASGGSCSRRSATSPQATRGCTWGLATRKHTTRSRLSGPTAAARPIQAGLRIARSCCSRQALPRRRRHDTLRWSRPALHAAARCWLREPTGSPAAAASVALRRGGHRGRAGSRDSRSHAALSRCLG